MLNAIGGGIKLFDTILFDLDGTLTDPFKGIANSVIYALKKFGIAAPEKTLLRKFIGPPLTESFSKYCGLSRSDALRAVEYYREYFAATGIFENKPYIGVQELLSELKKSGFTVVVATSKPEQFAKAIVCHFGLDQYFKEVCGATMDQSRTQKADVIAYALQKCGITNTKLAVMIGDRKHDIIGAKANGLHSIGVLYGYGSKEELLATGADHIANSPADILHYISE